MLKDFKFFLLLTCFFDMNVGSPSIPLETFGGFNSAENEWDSNIVFSYCRRPAKCHPLNNVAVTCLGTKLPYNHTTLDLVPGLSSLEEVQEHLQLWRGLSDFPKCWAVIQPFLCSVYMPKCGDEMVHLPSQEMCKTVMNSCRILTIERDFWPVFLKCTNQTKFPRGCKNDVQLKFNNTGRCKKPMVQTDNPVSYYDGVEGCGVQCDNPLFTLDERNQIHRLVAWAATACFLFNLFAVVTFIIDWKTSSKYPALVIFYINFCFLIVCVGWLVQFLPGGREDIVCRKDGTLRVGEPSSGENLSCVVVFVLTYYFLVAGIVWFVILTYAWHISFQALGKIQERMDKKGAYFHLVAWSLPLVLTITILALCEIDGNSVSGICFVGSVNHVYRAIFLLVPVLAALSVGGFFLFKGLLTLIKLKISSQEIISERASAKIRETILRMGFFSVLIFIFGLTIFVCHIYEFRHSTSWNDSFRKFIVCRVVKDPSNCRMKTRPSLAILQLHLLSLFATGITMSSWVWTSSTVHIWKRFLRRVTGTKDVTEPVTLKKHKVIAQVFAKRQYLNSDGRISISIRNTHQDPVALNFELNSLASGDLSTTWAAALPKLMTRRGALVAVANSSSSQRRNSMDSEISYSVRRVSVESRRHSLDSAVSVQLSEITKTVRKGSRRPTPRGRSKRRRRETKHRSSQVISRRNSSTSQESQLGAQILSALSIGAANLPPITSVVPGSNLKRRPGNAGLDDQLNILAGKLFGTLTNSHGIKLPNGSIHSSEEEANKENNDAKVGENSIVNDSNTKTCTKSDDEEEEQSDDATLPLTESYKNKIEVDEKTNKTCKKIKRKSDIDIEDGRHSRKNYVDDRNSKLSNRSDKSRTSRTSKNKDGESELRRSYKKDRESKRERKHDGKVYQSCSDMENCTDDLKWVQSEGEGKSLCGKVSVGIATDSSFSPELLPLTYQSSSGVSLGGNPNLGREIGTQTSVSFNNNEDPLNNSYEDVTHRSVRRKSSSSKTTSLHDA